MRPAEDLAAQADEARAYLDQHPADEFTQRAFWTLVWCCRKSTAFLHKHAHRYTPAERAAAFQRAADRRIIACVESLKALRARRDADALH